MCFCWCCLCPHDASICLEEFLGIVVVVAEFGCEFCPEVVM